MKLSKMNMIPTWMTSSRALSTFWFSLCTTLVWKYNELVSVFFAFAGSFSIAMFLASFQDTSKDLQRSKSTKKSLDHVKIVSTPVRNIHRHEYDGKMNTIIKIQVGLLASISALLIEIASRSYSHEGETHHNEYPQKLRFHSCCIMTGYLAFDLWFDNLYCRKFPPRILNTMEDALTLSAFSILLTRWNLWIDPTSISAVYIPHSSLDIWLFYKIVRLLLQLRYIKMEQPEELKTQTFPENESLVDRNIKSSRWTIHGVDYDLTDFVSSHPGGEESILLGRDRDCTALFESYHPFTDKHRAVLQKYRAPPSKISQTKTTSLPSATSGPHCPSTTDFHSEDVLYNTLKSRVQKKLKSHGIDPIKNRCATLSRNVYYMVIFTCLLVSGYYHCAKANPIGSILFALFGWLIGALGHDAGHFAFSRNPLFNDVGVWAMSFLCNPIMWQHQHTYAHHSHTNDFDQDPDLHHFELLLRVHKKCTQKSLYKYQRNVVYVSLAYALVVFGECIKIPLIMMQTGSLYGIVDYTDQNRTFRAFGMYFHYAAYLLFIVISPIISASFWWVGLLCAVLHIVSIGWMFAVFSQINHLNEPSLTLQSESEMKSSKSILKEKSLSIGKSWAANQIKTSNNFAADSLFWYLLSNGLNYQIEHHLFPGLNHCHLHLIAPIVKDTCEEFGVEYKSYDSWSDVMNATLKWLKVLSPEPL